MIEAPDPLTTVSPGRRPRRPHGGDQQWRWAGVSL